jgi:hypothetical protein
LKARTNPQFSPKEAMGQEYGMEWLNTVASVFLMGLCCKSEVVLSLSDAKYEPITHFQLQYISYAPTSLNTMITHQFQLT